MCEGFHPWTPPTHTHTHSLSVCLSLSLSLRALEKVRNFFDFNWQELNIKKRRAGSSAKCRLLLSNLLLLPIWPSPSWLSFFFFHKKKKKKKTSLVARLLYRVKLTWQCKRRRLINRNTPELNNDVMKIDGWRSLQREWRGFFFSHQANITPHASWTIYCSLIFHLLSLAVYYAKHFLSAAKVMTQIIHTLPLRTPGKLKSIIYSDSKRLGKD